ncbi:MAG: mannose-6-phosphate isomerase, class I, partial [Chitinophagaceae bacterium]
ALSKEPCAEYWLGAHPNFPSILQLGSTEVSLVDFIKDHPKEALGNDAAVRFGALPFLFKVLDVAQMLSIQVHPSLAEAGKGYEAEERAGVPVKAPHRNYKDRNHKPEQMVALSDFWLLHGFKPAEKLQSVLSLVPELAFLSEVFAQQGYKHLYSLVMGMGQAEMNILLQPLADRIVPIYKDGQLGKESEDFWAARAIDSFCKNGNFDRGLFSIYFFNLVHLKRGEGIFQPAGMPHAYLEGQNIEVMANSDNVLRGGLTDKHVAVEELLKHTLFEPTEPNILYPDTAGWYDCPAEEFQLCQAGNSSLPKEFNSRSAEILFVLKGSLQLHNDKQELEVHAGEACFICAHTQVQTLAETGTEVYRVAISRA